MTAPPPDDGRLSRVRVLARALDSAVTIPGTSFRFGLDPLIGLVPGLGDVAGAILSAYIVLVGIQLGVSRPAVVRMIMNIGIDTFVGSVPVVGDLFDAAWRSNNRNVALIERHVANPGASRRADRLVVLGAVVALLLLLAGGMALTILVVRLLVGLLH